VRLSRRLIRSPTRLRDERFWLLARGGGRRDEDE